MGLRQVVLVIVVVIRSMVVAVVKIVEVVFVLDGGVAAVRAMLFFPGAAKLQAPRTRVAMRKEAQATTLGDGMSPFIDIMRIIVKKIPQKGQMVLGGMATVYVAYGVAQWRGKSCTTARTTAISSTARRMMRSELLRAGHDR